MHNRLVKPGRVAGLVILILLLLTVYLVALYKLQIIEGEANYNRSSELTNTERVVTAARGNIYDRYGRTLVSNEETYNLKIDTDKLFANDDPNSVILELVHMVQGYGDEYTDDLPITMTPPFEYDPDMTTSEMRRRSVMLSSLVTSSAPKKSTPLIWSMGVEPMVITPTPLCA